MQIHQTYARNKRIDNIYVPYLKVILPNFAIHFTTKFISLLCNLLVQIQIKMSRLLLVLFIIILYSTTVNAQPIYKIDSVDHILLYSNGLNPLRKENETYIMRYIYSINPFKIYESLLREIPKKYPIISIDDLTFVSQDEWIEKFMNVEYIINSEYFDFSQNFETIEMIHPNIWILRGYKAKKDYQKNDGSVKWQINYVSPKHMHYVELPNGALYVQGTGNNYIMPLKNGFCSGTGNKGFLKEVFNPEKYQRDKEGLAYETMEYMNFSNFCRPSKNENGKYELRDLFDKTLIGAEYDTIHINQFFVAGYNKNKYDIYSTLLEPIEDSVGGFNFNDYYIEFIKNNHFFTKGVKGDIIIPQTRNKFRCGTVPHYAYKIEKTEQGEFYLIDEIMLKSKTLLGNTTEWDDMKFLNGLQGINYDSNDILFHNIGVNYNWIIVKKDNKQGIVNLAYDYKNKKYSVQKALPIEYDSIHFKSYYDPILLYKDNIQQICIFIYEYNEPDNSRIILSPDFKNIEIKSKYFIRYETLDGEKGWYDILKAICIADSTQ